MACSNHSFSVAPSCPFLPLLALSCPLVLPPCCCSSRQVPILVDGEAVLYESLAILQYLENFYPDKPLLPTNRVKHALAQVRMQVSN